MDICMMLRWYLVNFGLNETQIHLQSRTILAIQYAWNACLRRCNGQTNKGTGLTLTDRQAFWYRDGSVSAEKKTPKKYTYERPTYSSLPHKNQKYLTRVLMGLDSKICVQNKSRIPNLMHFWCNEVLKKKVMLLKGYLSYFAGGFSLHLLNRIDNELQKFHWASCQAHQFETISIYINFRFHYIERKTNYFWI